MRILFQIGLFFFVFLCSCVSKTEHSEVQEQNRSLILERDKFKKELEDIKFGAPNLLSEGKKFFEAKEFAQAKEKFSMLIDKHPEMSQTIEARHYLTMIDEEDAWNKALTSDDVSFTKSYIQTYPSGKYSNKAKAREKEVIANNMKKAYVEAENLNTAYAWENFLEQYPDHNESDNIKKKIIRLRVNEISSDSKTGKMPQFDHQYSGYSSTSSVSIKNDTGCELTVWYSGPDAKVIVIPIGNTRTVSLTSGDYQLAASACGSNYASSENLSGSYSSSFYIRTYKY